MVAGISLIAGARGPLKRADRKPDDRSCQTCHMVSGARPTRLVNPRRPKKAHDQKKRLNFKTRALCLFRLNSSRSAGILFTRDDGQITANKDDRAKAERHTERKGTPLAAFSSDSEAPQNLKSVGNGGTNSMKKLCITKPLCVARPGAYRRQKLEFHADVNRRVQYPEHGGRSPEGGASGIRTAQHRKNSTHGEIRSAATKPAQVRIIEAKMG